MLRNKPSSYSLFTFIFAPGSAARTMECKRMLLIACFWFDDVRTYVYITCSAQIKVPAHPARSLPAVFGKKHGLQRKACKVRHKGCCLQPL